MQCGRPFSREHDEEDAPACALEAPRGLNSRPGRGHWVGQRDMVCEHVLSHDAHCVLCWLENNWNCS
jgi:hypothetical protein